MNAAYSSTNQHLSWHLGLYAEIMLSGDSSINILYKLHYSMEHCQKNNASECIHPQTPIQNASLRCSLSFCSFRVDYNLLWRSDLKVM